MPKKKEIIGLKFGKLLVLSEIVERSNDNRILYSCICDCGKAHITKGKYLLNGDTQSCGCYEREALIKRSTKHKAVKTTEYVIWKGIRQRCNNPKNPAYSYYGGRGIIICKEWDSFAAFLKDVGNRPEGNYSIDRIDTNGNYEPSNVRWATKLEQSTNTRFNRNIPHAGITLHLNGWAKYFGIPVSTLHSRLKVKSIETLYANHANNSKKSS